MAKEETKIINDFKPLIATQKFTKPKPRYSDVSICGALDKLSILRPSMANGQITKLLVSRGYIDIKGGSITATDLGIKVVEFLVSSGFAFMEPTYTADMEKDLDLIADGKKERVELLSDFYSELLNNIDNANKIKQDKQKTNYSCPLCKAALLLKHSKFGPFFSCSNYKKSDDGCKYIAKVGENGEPIEKIKKSFNESEFKCSSCGEKLIVRTNKKGEYLGCRNWNKSKKCMGFYDMNGQKTDYELKKKKYWKKKKNESD